MSLPNLQQMLGQVKQLQEQLQQRLGQISVETSVGGGMVTVRMNGHKQLTAVEIDSKAVNNGDREMLQDLLLSAVNEASRRVDEELKQEMGQLTGGLNLPKIPGLF